MKNYLTVKQCAEKHPAFTTGCLRWLIFNNEDFAKKVIKRLGKKILIDEEALGKYIESSPSFWKKYKKPNHTGEDK